MKKLIGLFALAAAFGLAPAQAANWNLSAEQPDGNYHTENARLFAADIDKATNGGVKIRVHSNSVLLKRAEVKRGVQQGMVQVGDVLVAAIGNEDPLFEVDSVPLLATSFDQAKKLWEASRKPLADRLLKQGIVLLYAIPWPPQGLYAAKPVASLDDLKGVRFRAYSPATSRLASLMGTVPVTVNPTEVAQAFSAGLINAMLTSPKTGVDSQAWDFVKYYYDVKAFIPKNFVIVNKAAFDALTDAQKKAVLDAAKAAEERGWKMGVESTTADTKMLGDKGMNVAPTPPALAKSFESIGATMLEEWLAKAGADGKAVVDAYRK
jgi:TRAP-type C4-dicarboxylate transport system substrate-binding protein